MAPTKVDTPATFRSSSSVCPSTSKLPLASMLLAKVAVSATFRTSKSVCPSTSRLPFASMLPEKVHL